MQNVKFSVKGKGISELPKILKKEFEPSFYYVSHGGDVFFYVFEKFSFLQGSDMSGSILVDLIGDNECMLNVVVSGGKIGLLRLDLFGRENSVVNNIKDSLQEICEKKNWTLR